MQLFDCASCAHVLSAGTSDWLETITIEQTIQTNIHLPQAKFYFNFFN